MGTIPQITYWTLNKTKYKLAFTVTKHSLIEFAKQKSAAK